MAMIKAIKDGVIDIVYSPDDGGYYLQKYKFSTKEDWVSKRIYATHSAAEMALKESRVRWE